MTAPSCRSPLLTVGLAALTVLGLIRFAPAVGELRAGLSHPHAWLTQVGPDAGLAAFAGVLLWIAALWLAIGLLAAALSRLPGRPGHLAATFARRALPTAIRSVVLTSTGASLMISPVAAIAAGPAAQAQPAAADSTPFWPLDQPGQPLPAPSWPTSVAKSPATPPAQLPPSSTTTVTVQPGDSLWSVTGHRLGATATTSLIAIEWPYWYKANRNVIGSDPNLLRPGTELVVPDHATGSAR